MRKKHLIWQIFQPYLFIILVAFTIFAIYFASSFKDFYLKQTARELEQKADLIREYISEFSLDTDKINKILIDFDKLTGTRATLISIEGKVITDSRKNIDSMDKHSDREEFIEAINGNLGYSIRESSTLKTEMMYLAIPLKDKKNETIAVIRTSESIEEINYLFRKIYIEILTASIIIFIISSIAGYILSRKVTKPISIIKQGAERFSRGDLKHKIYPFKVKEFDSLSESLNTMAKQLDEKIDMIVKQKNLQDAVLESMKEGLVAVDNNDVILLINNEAKEILNLAETDITGRTIQETIRIPEIQNFFVKLFDKGRKEETEVIIQYEKEKVLQLTGTLLKDSNRNSIGAIVVMNDVSRLKYLDSIKKDLVANVSHELRTPLTAIMGFIETLKEGILNDPEKSQKFLDIISKNINRLNLIINDLLSLSRIEQAEEMNSVEFESVRIRDIILQAIDIYQFSANSKNINIELNCEDEKKCLVNPHLFEQAIGNLIDNSIKYSPENTKVKIKCGKDENNIYISIKDEGYGISQEHLPRLFERFYRIDKSRNREEGGTGLGLAIVKHIVQIHKGEIKVNSEPDKGTEFIIYIPTQ